jgi:hypothetical protein
MGPRAADFSASDARRLVIDRWEGDLAVVELDDGRVVELPGWLLPTGAREGDVVMVRSEVAEAGTRCLRLRIDAAATRATRAAAEALLARLRADDPGRDLEP